MNFNRIYEASVDGFKKIETSDVLDWISKGVYKLHEEEIKKDSNLRLNNPNCEWYGYFKNGQCTVLIDVFTEGHERPNFIHLDTIEKNKGIPDSKGSDGLNALIGLAKKSYKGITLQCYDENLFSYYEKYGFKADDDTMIEDKGKQVHENKHMTLVF
jgi:hypothetical protein